MVLYAKSMCDEPSFESLVSLGLTALYGSLPERAQATRTLRLSQVIQPFWATRPKKGFYKLQTLVALMGLVA